MPKAFDSVAYFGRPISENISETAEGYLICHNAPIAKVGMQEYSVGEIKDKGWKELLKGRPETDIVKMYRLPEDVFDKYALASLEGKPFADDHPYNVKSGDITPENHKQLAKGHIQNIRKDDDYVVADIWVTDPKLIAEIKRGERRELSVGYGYEVMPYLDGWKQINIIANHVALVKQGRAGHDCRVYDSAEHLNKKRSILNMSLSQTQASMLLAFAKENPSAEEFAKAFKAFDSKKAQDEDEEEGQSAMDSLIKKMKDGLDGLKGKKKAHDADNIYDPENAYEVRMKRIEDSIEELKKSKDSKKAHDKKSKDSADELEEMLEDDEEDDEPEEKKVKDKKKAHDEDAHEEEGEDEEDAEEDEKKSLKEHKKEGKDRKSAHDSAMRSIISGLKPTIAALPNRHREAVKDALRSIIHDRPSGDVYGQIMRATDGYVKKERESEGQTTEDEMMAKVAQIKARSNPHHPDYGKQA